MQFANVGRLVLQLRNTGAANDFPVGFDNEICRTWRTVSFEHAIQLRIGVSCAYFRDIVRDEHVADDLRNRIIVGFLNWTDQEIQ